MTMNQSLYTIDKPATGDSQNSHKHISQLSHKKKVHAQELLTHILQFVLFSHAVGKGISYTFSQENGYVFCKVTSSTTKTM